MRWLPRRCRRRRHEPGWAPPERIPDGDTVLRPGVPRWADLLREAAEEPTRPLPVVRPLLTPGGWWRTRHFGRRR